MQLHLNSLITPSRLAIAAAAIALVTAPAADQVPADPGVGNYEGTFQPQGWSAGFGHKARFDKPEEVDTLERAGIDPASLKPEEAFAAYAAIEAAASTVPSAPSNYDGQASGSGTKPHRCAACHTTATIERKDTGYQLAFVINHGKDKEGKPILVRRTIPGNRVASDQIVFGNEKYRVEWKGGELSGRFTGLMISKIKLHRAEANVAAPAKGE